MYALGPTYNEFDYNDHPAKANKFYASQECIPVRCVPPARYRTGEGGLPDRPPWTETLPGQRPSWINTLPQTETPLDRDFPPEQNHRQV